MKQIADPICSTVTGGVLCNHPLSEHDSGGCCKASFCACSRLSIGGETSQPPTFDVDDREIFITSTDVSAVIDAQILLSRPLRDALPDRFLEFMDIDYPKALASEFCSEQTKERQDWNHKCVAIIRDAARRYTQLIQYSDRERLARATADPLIEFDTQSADFAQLAVWAYKAHAELKRMKGL